MHRHRRAGAPAQARRCKRGHAGTRGCVAVAGDAMRRYGRAGASVRGCGDAGAGASAGMRGCACWAQARGDAETRVMGVGARGCRDASAGRRRAGMPGRECCGVGAGCSSVRVRGCNRPPTRRHAGTWGCCSSRDITGHSAVWVAHRGHFGEESEIAVTGECSCAAAAGRGPRGHPTRLWPRGGPAVTCGSLFSRTAGPVSPLLDHPAIPSGPDDVRLRN